MSSFTLKQQITQPCWRYVFCECYVVVQLTMKLHWQCIYSLRSVEVVLVVFSLPMYQSYLLLLGLQKLFTMYK